LSIDIPNPGAGGTLNEKRFAADVAERTHRRIDATWNALLGFGK
jgi:hypothetical protein